MGKYSDFEEIPKGYYPTPFKGAKPLLPFIRGLKFVEPCAGDGRLIDHLGKDNCVAAFDIEPRADYKVGHSWSYEKDVFDLTLDDLRYSIPPEQTDMITIDEFSQCEADVIITNPDWKNDKASGYQLNRVIMHLSDLKPTWLLLDGNFMFNLKSEHAMDRCSDIVPVGRLKWIDNSPHTGKENCAWFKFDKNYKGEAKVHTRRKIK